MKKKAGENIKRRDKEQLKKVHELATIIGEGKMTGKSAGEVQKLADYMGISKEEAQRNPQIQNIMQSSLKYAESKENLCKTLGISVEEAQKDPKLIGKKLRELKKDKENTEKFKLANQQYKNTVEAQKEMCKVGARFAQQEGRKIYFNSLVDQAAINMAEAQMLDKVARNGSAFEGKDLTETFKSMSEQNRLALNEATSNERANYVKGQNLKTIYPVSGMAPVQVNLPGTIERYNNMSRQASDAAVSNIAWFRIAEMGKQPRPNRTLNNLEKMVEEQRRKHQPPTEEKQQEAEQTAAEEKKQREEELKNPPREDAPQTPPPHNMCEEAADNQTVDKQHQNRRSSFEEEKSALTVREAQHAQRGSFLLSRINQIKYQKQQELIAEGRKNNFQGWKYMPRGQEM